VIYQRIADRFAAHQAYGWNTQDSGELLRTIGYPLFLAAVRTVFGQGAGNVALVQLFLSGLLIFIAYFYLRGVVGTKAAFIAALLLGLDPLTILWSLTELTEGLFTLFFFSAAVLLSFWASSQRRYLLVAAGALLGLACLIRPVGQAFLAIWALAIFLFPFDKLPWKLSSAVPRIKPVLLFLAPAVLLIAPWVVRNGLLWNCASLSSVDRITMRDFTAAKVIVEYEHIPLAAAQHQLQALDPGPCPSRTADYFRIVLDHPLVYAKMVTAAMVPTLFGTSFDRWLELYGINYKLPDLWRPLMDKGPVAVLDVLRTEFIRLPQGISLMVALTAYQLLLYFFALIGFVALRKPGSPPRMWWLILLAVVILALVLSPTQEGNERFRVPLQPIVVCLAGYGLAYSVARARYAYQGSQTMEKDVLQA
jgi:4-amino-4-deoxy-L-arabinose transferase-like glycosyltransferase